ncbi:hypothetical protein V1289_005273 [Bradyrhizobium sp. AZCC 2289]
MQPPYNAIVSFVWLYAAGDSRLPWLDASFGDFV